MFGESPSWETPVVEEMLERSPTSATIDYFLTISIAYLLDPE
jgi:hypothetical protein